MSPASYRAAPPRVAVPLLYVEAAARQGIEDTVLSTLAAYVEALGASLLVVADFGEEQFVLRRVPAPASAAASFTAPGPAAPATSSGAGG